jgi:hypothetical protein
MFSANLYSLTSGGIPVLRAYRLPPLFLGTPYGLPRFLISSSFTYSLLLGYPTGYLGLFFLPTLRRRGYNTGLPSTLLSYPFFLTFLFASGGIPVLRAYRPPLLPYTLFLLGHPTG